MIAASVDTKDFSQVLPQERFSVDAPITNPPMAASSLDITRTEFGMDFSVAEKTLQKRSGGSSQKPPNDVQSSSRFYQCRRF